MWTAAGLVVGIVAALALVGPIGIPFVLAGFALSFLGSLPCSSLISPLACSGAILTMGLSFGLVQALILRTTSLALLEQAHIMREPFVSVVGGLIGLPARTMRQRFSLPALAGMIAIIPASIVSAAWLMSQPGHTCRKFYRFSRKKGSSGTVVGNLAGGGIGAIFGLAAFLSNYISTPDAFLISVSLVSAIWMGVATAIRNRSMISGVVNGIVHASVLAGLAAVAFANAGTITGFVALAAACGFFHSVFFTTAFVVGERLGGYRAGFLAAAIEGAAGFTAFIILRMVGCTPPVLKFIRRRN